MGAELEPQEPNRNDFITDVYRVMEAVLTQGLGCPIQVDSVSFKGDALTIRAKRTPAIPTPSEKKSMDKCPVCGTEKIIDLAKTKSCLECGHAWV